ncbi:phospholipid/cholesterol/gamma-HCH transport system substrate-binding protein [Gammaproteobacteria bacterium]
MNQEHQKYQRLGMVVLVVLVLGFLGGVVLNTYFSDTLVLRTQLARVGGLRMGAEVLMSGFSVGHVVAIQPVDESMRRFDVSIRLDRRYLIPNDSQVALYQSHPLDVVRLSLEPGHSETLFKSGDLVPNAPLPPNLLDVVTRVGLKADALLDRLNTLAEQATQATMTVNQVLGDPTRPRNATVSAVLAKGQTVLAQADATLATLHEEIKRSQIARNLTSLSEETRKALQMSRTSLEQIQITGKRADTLLGQISTLTADNASDLRRMTRDSEFVLRSLATNITTLVENLQSLTINLSDLAQAMRNNPDAILFGRRPHDEPGTTRPKSSKP